MSQFTYFTKQQKYQVNQIPIKDILTHFDESVMKSGKEWRWSKHDSLTMKDNVWFQHSMQRGGMSVDFLMTFFEYNYHDAVQFLLDNFEIASCTNANIDSNSNAQLFIPTSNDNNDRVISYLLTRCIDKDIIQHFIENKLMYEDAKYHNVVFIGYDENNEIKHIHQHGTNPKVKYKGNALHSDSRYSFHYIGTNNRLYVFEAPIDLLSFITLNSAHWKANHYLALCGTTTIALNDYLKRVSSIYHIFLCLDNDIAGNQATARIIDELTSNSKLTVSRLLPRFKDFNDDLMFMYHQSMETPEIKQIEAIRLNIFNICYAKKVRHVNLEHLQSLFSQIVYKLDDSKNIDFVLQQLKEMICVCIYTVQKHYKQLERNLSSDDLYKQLQSINNYLDYPNSNQEILESFMKKLATIKGLENNTSIITKMEKETLLNHYMSLLNFMLNAHVFLLAKKGILKQ